jgi:hypothetical protein
MCLLYLPAGGFCQARMNPHSTCGNASPSPPSIVHDAVKEDSRHLKGKMGYLKLSTPFLRIGY